MKQKTKLLQTQIRDPVLLENGNMIFDVTLTTNLPDRDGDIVNPLGVTGLETAVIAYNHQRCYGIPVTTGAKILLDTVIQTAEELRVQILVKTTDEMFFCDVNGVKRSNGKLLEAINSDQVKNTSIGFRFNPNDVKKIFQNGKTYTYYDQVILNEFSLLDVLSSNPKSIIHKSMKSEQEKQKCLDCLRKAGIGSFAINPDGLVVKVTEVTDEKVTGQDFDGNQIELNDSFESVQYEQPEMESEVEPEVEAEKACGCSKKPELPKAETKAEGDIDPNAKVEPEDVKEDLQMQTLIETVNQLMGMVTDLTSKLDATTANNEQNMANTIEQVKKTIQEQNVLKFAKQEPEIKVVKTTHPNF